MPKLSIIVPIYKVEQYLPRCIDSILAQTYTDFELILINDGSPDNCAEIMEQYAQKDVRIITVHQENKGVSAARNAGLRNARGKYIGFVDPDDWIERDYFEELICFLEEKELDIVCCNWLTVKENGEQSSYSSNEISKQMGQIEFLNHLFDSPRTIGGSCWNKVFLKEKIEVFFDEKIAIGEDWLFFVNYCKKVKKAGYIDETLYCFFERPDSTTRKDVRVLTNGLHVKEQILQIAKSISKDTQMYAEKDFLDCCYLFFKRFEKEKKYSMFSLNLLKNYLKQNIVSVICNSKIYWKTKMLYLVTCVLK